MPVFERDRAIFAAVLCTAFSACTGLAGAAAPTGTAPATGGTAMPQVIPPTTGGVGYGDPSTHSLVVGPTAVVGGDVIARGTMPGGARKRVVLQRLDAKHGWRNVARARIRTTERFAVRWRADRSGRIGLRAVLARDRRTAAASAAPIAAINVYRPAKATFYGPDFFGKQTACGQTLTPELHGVAHKKLPCGTQIAIMFAGREIVVPVIDRGPFNGDYSWDLTQATSDALAFTAIGAGKIGYRRADPAPAPAR
jgi:rare lipoprotein A (peptidoglycan hydrolase)